jgi:hypothetical protein
MAIIAGLTPLSPIDEWHYICKKVSVGVNVYTESSVPIRSYPDDLTAINWALNNLDPGRDYQENVLLKGSFVTNGTILVDSYTYLKLMGKVTLANGSDVDLLQNMHPANYDSHMTIEGGLWDGNSAGQAAGDVMHFEGVNPYPLTDVPTNKLLHVKLRKGFRDCLYMDDSGKTYISWFVYDVQTRDCGRYGVHLRSQTDSFFSEVGCFGSQDHNMLIWNCGISFFDHLYLGGATHECLEIQGSDYLKFDSVFANQSLSQAILLDGVTGSQFQNIHVHGTDALPANLSAIKLQTRGATNHSIRNIFNNIMIGITAGGNTWKYGIEEADANQDYNNYGNVTDYASCVTAVLRMLGANSKNCNVVGTVAVI